MSRYRYCRRFAALPVFVVPFIAFAAVRAGEPAPPAGENKVWHCGHMAAMEAAALSEQASPRGAGDPQAETPLTDVTHTKIDIAVDPDAQTVSGAVTSTVESMIEGLSQFTVYLHSSMSIQSVGGAGVSYIRAGDSVVITLDRAYGAGETFDVSVNYSGSPFLGIYWGTNWFQGEEVGIVATLSQPFYARGWWPGKDVLNDKSTFDIWLTVPDTHTAVSNGILRGTDALPGNKTRFRWEETYPMIPYLASIAVADYALYETTYSHLGDTMPMQFYLLPGDFDAENIAFANQYVIMTRVFSDIYGQYPFINEKGGMAHTPTLGGTFMEHQTIPSMPTFSNPSINAHELAHQWWGDNVTCETWQHMWLNEGLATFSQAVWEEFKPGGTTGDYHAEMASNRPSNPDVRVLVTNVNSSSSIFSNNAVYRKGAWVAHMLRGVLGDDNFFQALRDYRAAFEGDSATTQEFINSISQTAGYDLSFFTDQWVMNSGSPDYEYAWTYAEAACSSSGLNHLLLRIRQNQTARGYGLFTMPIQVRVGGLAQSFTVWSLKQEETFAIPVASVPASVQLDPARWILTNSVTEVSGGAFAPICQGDMNEDGLVNGDDIQAFVSALVDRSAGPTSWRRADMDFNNTYDAEDLSLFIETLLDRLGPPTPNPMAFSILPHPISTSQVTMRAVLAEDSSGGVEYRFSAAGAGSHSSTWQASRDYTDSGLLTNWPYSYSVVARDGSPMQLTTAPSASANVATMIETPLGVSFGSVTADSIDVVADGVFTNLQFGFSGIFFEMSPPVAGSGANEWVKSPTLHIVNLSPGVEYTFRVKARNFFGIDETPWIGPIVVSTTD